MMSIGKETLVLEVGCAEAGNLKPFVDSGCLATGVDISCGRIELAKSFFQDHPQRQNLTLICEDIYKLDLKGKDFDLIIMRDVIEHLPNQKYFMDHVKKFLKPDGKIFIAFLPSMAKSFWRPPANL